MNSPMTVLNIFELKLTNILLLLLCDKAHLCCKIAFSPSRTLSFGHRFKNKQTHIGPKERKKERKIKMLFIFAYVTHDLMVAAAERLWLERIKTQASHSGN